MLSRVWSKALKVQIIVFKNVFLWIFFKKKRPSMTKQKDNLTRDLFHISSLISILLYYINQVLE